MNGRLTFIAVLVTTFAVSAIKADILLFDIDVNPGTWADAVTGLIPANHYDFYQDPDYGIASFDGPLTSEGGNPAGNPGPVSPGILPDKMIMDSEMGGPGGPGRGVGGDGMVAFGPNASFGNPGNAVLANFFVDAFAIWLDGNKRAYEFDVWTALGGPTVDIRATDQNGDQYSFLDVSIGNSGTTLGLLGVGSSQIRHVSIYDPDDGAEGVLGVGVTYVIPEPRTAALLGFLAVGMMIRRRRTQLFGIAGSER